MTEQDFIKHIEQGYNLIPLKSTLINDGLDPIDVYQKLSNMPGTFDVLCDMLCCQMVFAFGMFGIVWFYTG